jgi:hypothetical protein
LPDALAVELRGLVEKSFVNVSVTGSPSMVWYADDSSIDKSSNA